MNVETTSHQRPHTERTALVTGVGAPRGIGRHVARELVGAGWNVVAADIDGDAATTFAIDLAKGTDTTIIGVGVDISDQSSVDAAFGRVDVEMPPLTALINLAGVASPQTIFELTPEMWDKVMDVNAKGTLLMMQAAAKRMIDGGFGGRIVNTSSITALDGGGTFSKTGYAAAKAAVQGLTRGGARELGKYGITCNVILPGPIDTDIMGGTLTAEDKDTMSANIPLERVGQPDEIAGLIKFLINEESSYINGASINADGGKHMH